MSLWKDYQADKVTLPLELNRDIPFISKVFQVRNGSAQMSEAVTLLRQAEMSNDVRLVKPRISNLPWLPDEQYEAVIQVNFYNFMSQTHLVLNPERYDEMSLLLPGGYTWEATWRAWSATLAEWANSAGYGGFANWDYVDVYNGLHNLVEGYREFEEVALRVIEAKCETD